jgi:hypothetical protein
VTSARAGPIAPVLPVKQVERDEAADVVGGAAVLRQAQALQCQSLSILEAIAANAFFTVGRRTSTSALN